MSRASDLRIDFVDEPEVQPEPQPKAVVKEPVVPVPDKFVFKTVDRAKLDADQQVASQHLNTICHILCQYPVYKLSYGDCQFIQALLYGISSRNALSPGQIKSLNSLKVKAKVKA